MKKGLVFTALVCAMSMGIVACKKTPPAPTLESITVTAPTKTVYLVDEQFDPTGMVVTAVYSDESTTTVPSSDYTYTSPDMSSAGQKTVTVTYQEKTASFTITVNEPEPPVPPEPELESITVTAPTKVEYAPNEQLDLTGMVVTAHFDDESDEVITEGYTVSSPDMSVAGKTTVTVTYEGKTDSFQIHIFQVSITNKAALQELWRAGDERSVSIRIPGVTVADAVERRELVISSDDEDVVSVNSMRLLANKEGNATITATYKGKYSDSVEVHIDKALTFRIVTEIEEDTEYLFGMVVASGKMEFATKAMNGYYINSTLEKDEAAKATVSLDSTKTDDYKYVIKLTDEDGTKTIGSVKTSGHINIGFVEDASATYGYETAYFKFNEDFSFSTMIGGEEFWIGTYGTYYTFSYRDATQIQFKARLYEEGEPVPATEIKLNKSELTLEVPKSEQLSATLKPVETTDAVVWSSSNEEVAVVNSRGLVSSVKAGTAVITAKAGEVSATCTVTVSGTEVNYGTQENPLLVDEALQVLDAMSENTLSVKKFWVKGIVTESDAEDAKNKNRNVWLQNNNGTNKKALELYRAIIDVNVIKDLPAAKNALRGKEIVVDGLAKLYKTSTASTYELTPDDEGTIVPTVRTMADPTFPEPTGFSLNATEKELQPEATFQLVATAEPVVIVPAVEWASSDKAVATVDSEGLVTAVAEGSATITATFGELTATCTITVAGEALNYGTEENPLTPEQAVALLQSLELESNVLTTEKLWVKGIVSDDPVMTVKQSGNTYTFWYKNTGGSVEKCFEAYSVNVGSGVDEEDIVKGAEITCNGYAKVYRAEGKDDIYEFGGNATVGYPTITKVVFDRPGLEDIEVPASISVALGESAKINVTASPAGASLKGLTFTSNDTNVVTVNAASGDLTPVAAGETTVTVAITAKSGLIEKTVTVTVTTALDYGTKDNPLTIAQAKALIDNIDPNVLTSQKVWVKGYVSSVEEYAYSSRNIWLAEEEGSDAKDFEIYSAQPASEFDVDFSKNDEVEEHINGMVIVANGWAKLYKSTSDPSKPQVYELTDKSDHTDKPLVYSAEAPALQSILLNENKLNLAPTGTATLVATPFPAKASLEGLTWESSDEDVATADANGLVTAVAAGSANIVAKVGTIESGACAVTVAAAANPAASCNISKDELALEVGGTETLTSEAVATDTESPLTDVAVWSSSDEGVATVNSSTGEVTAVAAGTATITVTWNASVSATCAVTVSAKKGTTEDNPLDVDDAIKIAQGCGGTATSESYYIEGVVTAFGTGSNAYNSQFKNGSVYFTGSDGTQFLVWRLAADTEEEFNENFKVGTLLKIYSPITSYNTTLETTQNPTVVSRDQTVVHFVKISGDSSVTEGGTITLSATTYPVTESVTWSSSDEDIATIDSATGKVTGVTAGEEVTITATAANGVTGSMVVSVVESGVTQVTKTASELQVENSWTICAGQGDWSSAIFTSFQLDENITVSFSGTGNTATYWSAGTQIRCYTNDVNTPIVVTITAASGFVIQSITLTFETSNMDGTSFELTSGVAVDVNAASASYSLVKGSKNPQLKITGFTVVYAVA